MSKAYYLAALGTSSQHTAETDLQERSEGRRNGFMDDVG